MLAGGKGTEKMKKNNLFFWRIFTKKHSTYILSATWDVVHKVQCAKTFKAWEWVWNGLDSHCSRRLVTFHHSKQTPTAWTLRLALLEWLINAIGTERVTTGELLRLTHGTQADDAVLICFCSSSSCSSNRHLTRIVLIRARHLLSFWRVHHRIRLSLQHVSFCPHLQSINQFSSVTYTLKTLCSQSLKACWKRWVFQTTR